MFSSVCGLTRHNLRLRVVPVFTSTASMTKLTPVENGGARAQLPWKSGGCFGRSQPAGFVATAPFQVHPGLCDIVLAASCWWTPNKLINQQVHSFDPKDSCSLLFSQNSWIVHLGLFLVALVTCLIIIPIVSIFEHIA